MTPPVAALMCHAIPAVMEPLLQKYPDVSLIASNLDVSAHPQYERILKPYVVREVETPWGNTKIGTIGVTTEEGAVGGLKYM
jgi:2',3'-cyclic-nucleotide 2'-phosphodiesterase (5'-nucleotidase family)